MNPFLFIVGCPRSGTTLLRRVVDAHPQIAVTHETHWIPGYFEKSRLFAPDGCISADLVTALAAEPRFNKLGVTPHQLEALIQANPPLHYANFVTAIFDYYGKQKGKSLVADKTPAYVRCLDTLHGLWPGAKFVHLIRDGRDVCLSAIHWDKAAKLARRFTTWSADPVTTAALWWEWHVRLGREAGGSLGPEFYYEIRYESLVTRPADECAALCAFLGLPYAESMLRFSDGRTKEGAGRDAKHAWLPITPGLRDWKLQMPAVDVERFEAAAGELLDDLGYAHGVVSAEARVRACPVRDTFSRDVQARGHPLPQRW